MPQHRRSASMRFRTPVNTARSIQWPKHATFATPLSGLRQRPAAACNHALNRPHPGRLVSEDAALRPGQLRRDGPRAAGHRRSGWTTGAACKVDALLLNAGGIMAFYPDEDSGAPSQRVAGRRATSSAISPKRPRRAACAWWRGWTAISRMRRRCSFGPEWFVRTADGQPVKHSESPWLFQTCMFTSYFTEQIPAIIREVNSLYDVDGFFTNGWPGTGGPPACRCEACRRLADAEHYRRLPSSTWRACWKSGSCGTTRPRRRSRTACTWAIWEAAYAPPPICGRLAAVAGWFNADHQGRSGATPIWDCAQQGRVAQSVMKGRCITNVTGSYANSSRCGGTPRRRRPKPPCGWRRPRPAAWCRGITGWAASPRTSAGARRAAISSSGSRSTSRTLSIASRWRRVGVVFSQRMNSLYTPPGGGAPSDFLQGMYYALLEGRFLFDFVHEDDLDAATLKKYAARDSAQHRDAERCAVRQTARLRARTAAGCWARSRRRATMPRARGGRNWDWPMSSARRWPETSKVRKAIRTTRGSSSGTRSWRALRRPTCCLAPNTGCR